MVGGVGKKGGVGFALDISLIPGHGSLFVSRREEYMCTRVCIRYKGRENAFVCLCMERVGVNRGVVEYKKYIYTHYGRLTVRSMYKVYFFVEKARVIST